MDVFKTLKVIELGRVYAGPLCGMVLSDLGIEVTKVERVATGDESRGFGKQQDNQRSSYFNSLNRNKKSIDLDLKKENDQMILIEMIKHADVFLHNWIQDTLDDLGFSYEAVQKINPKIIYCSISGFGYYSPYRKYPSQDIIAQSISGLMSLTGEKGGRPLKTGIPIVDYATGLYAAFMIMSALFQRSITNEGQLLSVSLLETALAITSFESSGFLTSNEVPKRSGNSHPSICPYNVYQTLDGFVTIAVANDVMFHRFCDALSLDALKNHDGFKTNTLRLKHQDVLERLIEEKTMSMSSFDLIKSLEAHKVSCAPVNELNEAFKDDKVIALDMVKVFEDEKNMAFIKKPWQMSKVDEVHIKKPPKLGEHRRSIIKELKIKEK